MPAATTSAKGAEGDAVDDGSAGEVRSFEAIKDARKLAEGVMDKVLGTAPPDDPSASPIKRLEAQMAGGSRRDEKVSRSPKEVRAIARSIAEEIGLPMYTNYTARKRQTTNSIRVPRMPIWG